MNLTLTQFKPFIKITIGFIVILIVAFIGFVLFSNQEDNQTSKQNTAEKDVVQPTETKKLPQEVNFKDELSNIKEVLPYLGKDYSIEYIESINIINVKITASSAEEYKEIKKDAENFIKAQGVGDICALNIFWIPQVPQEVRKTINAKTLITTGCPP